MQLPARQPCIRLLPAIAKQCHANDQPGRPAARLGLDPPSVGEAIGAFGHPLGMPFTGTRGIIWGRTDRFGPDLIQIDTSVDHGNSGCPVIALSSGHGVGMATTIKDGGNDHRVNLATPMSEVGRILSLLQHGSPDPPHMAFALLKNEDGRHTLQVACTFDAERWPFELGDRILALEGQKLERR